MRRTEPVDDNITADLFKARVHAWAERIGVEVKEIHLRDMRRKWASASVSGRLTFDFDVMRLPPEQRDNVIVHELVHLKVGNHGAFHRALIRGYLEELEP